DAYERYYAMAEPDFDWKKGPGKSSPKFRLNFRCTTEFMADIAEGAYYRIHEIYLRLLTDRRGCQLLIGLRRHKNKTGDWPESLDEIKAFVPAETFIDPTNEGVFVYKLTDDSFTLYSKGLNGIDEDGKREDEQDDWQIWPRLKRKSSCNNEEESADAE
ncbi:MAG: hypothetical protein KAS75_07025, partial [Planctomycetes bacterium]|nr:hypothetical protein [Planctomycetota bacterium]